MKNHRKTYYSVLLSAALIILAACHTNPAAENNSEVVTETQSAEDHSGHLGIVELVNGQKWQANPETTDGIQKMSSLLETISEEAEASDFDSLQVQLNKEFNTILQKCTMTGEAHDQLHNYLMPVAEMIKEIGSGDVADRDAASITLYQHLMKYHLYFE